MQKPKDLADIRNHLFNNAERYWLWSLGLAASIQVAGLVVIFLNRTSWIILAGTVTFIGQIVRMVLKEIAGDLQGKGDKCRRLILYSDALGIEIKPEDYAVAKSWVNLNDVAEAPFVKPYYLSTLAIGSQRLADITSESAFFTYCLADKTAKYLFSMSALLIFIALGMIYLSVQNLSSNGLGVILGQMALIIIGFLFFGDVFILYRRYSLLAQKSHEVFHKLSNLRNNPRVKECVVMQIVEDYNIKTTHAPPLPSFIYRRERDKINLAYRSTFTKDECHG